MLINEYIHRVSFRGGGGGGGGINGSIYIYSSTVQLFILDCPIRFLSRVLRSFIWEKLLSTEAVPTGIERQMFARVLMLGVGEHCYQHFVSGELCQLGARGGHSNRLCTNTHDRGQELGQAVKAEGKAVKGTSQIRKSQGSSIVKGQPGTKSHQSTILHLVEQVRSRVSKDYLSGGQGPKFKVKFFDRGRGC